jgi:hypothetical protein
VNYLCQTRRITIDANDKKTADKDESDFLLSKKEMLARAIGNMGAPPPVVQTRPVGIGVRSRELWSPKSSNLYGMLTSIVDPNKTINFAALDMLNTNTFIGIPNTFRASTKEPGHMEKYFSVWSYFNKSFVMSKVSNESAYHLLLIAMTREIKVMRACDNSMLNSDMLHTIGCIAISGV